MFEDVLEKIRWSCWNGEKYLEGCTISGGGNEGVLPAPYTLSVQLLFWTLAPGTAERLVSGLCL